MFDQYPMPTTDPKQSSPNIDVLCRFPFPLAHHGSGNCDSHLVESKSPEIDAAPALLRSGSACSAKRSTSTFTMLPTTGMKLEERMEPIMRKAKAARDKARKKSRKYIWALVALYVFTVIAATLGAAAIGELSPEPSSVAKIVGRFSILFNIFSFFTACYFLYQYSGGHLEEALRHVWELEAFVKDLRRFIFYDNSSVTALLETEKTVAHDRRRYEMIRGSYQYDDDAKLFRKVEDTLMTWKTAAGVASEQGKRSEVDGVMRGD